MQQHFSLDQIQTRLYTAVISDVLDQVGCLGQVAAPGLRPVAENMTLAGYARTARAVVVNRAPEDPYAKLLEAIDRMTSMDVLVIAVDPFSHSAIFGGLLATAVKAAGGRGVVIDGFARDASELRQLGLPTFARGLVPLDSYGRDEVVEIDQQVTISGIPVRSGDLVFADSDGLVVVPSELESIVVERALAKMAGEGEVRQALRDGMKTVDAFAKYGIL